MRQIMEYAQTNDLYAHLTEKPGIEDAQILGDYLAAGESVYYRFAQLAYQCARKKESGTRKGP